MVAESDVEDDILGVVGEEIAIGSQDINTVVKQPSGGESMSFNGLLRSAGLEMTPPKKDEAQLSSGAFQIMVEKIDGQEEDDDEPVEGA